MLHPDILSSWDGTRDVSSNVMTFSSFGSFRTVFLVPPTAAVIAGVLQDSFYHLYFAVIFPFRAGDWDQTIVTGCSYRTVRLPLQRNWAAARDERFAAVPRLTSTCKTRAASLSFGKRCARPQWNLKGQSELDFLRHAEYLDTKCEITYCVWLT